MSEAKEKLFSLQVRPKGVIQGTEGFSASARGMLHSGNGKVAHSRGEKVEPLTAGEAGFSMQSAKHSAFSVAVPLERAGAEAGRGESEGLTEVVPNRLGKIVGSFRKITQSGEPVLNPKELVANFERARTEVSDSGNVSETANSPQAERAHRTQSEQAPRVHKFQLSEPPAGAPPHKQTERLLVVSAGLEPKRETIGGNAL